MFWEFYTDQKKRSANENLVDRKEQRSQKDKMYKCVKLSQLAFVLESKLPNRDSLTNTWLDYSWFAHSCRENG